MKKLLTVAALLLPLAAAAQYEPVAPAAESAPSYDSRRSPWYIGFGIGGGNGNMSGLGNTVTFSEAHSNLWGMSVDPANVVVNFKLGLTLSPTLLIGYDTTGIISMYSSGGASSTLQIVNYDAMATWFPQGEGLFLRGGAGLSKFTLTLDDAYGTATESASGFNVIAGVGYALWVGQSFNLTINLDYSLQSYGSSATEIDSSNFFAAWVGFDWY
jgi:opacity protein-like surface antigen